jgi:hypothetical protein
MEIDQAVITEIISLFRKYKDTTPPPRLIDPSLDGVGTSIEFDEFDTTNFYIEKIMKLIHKLTPNARAELIAIMLLGRNEGPQVSFDILLHDAKTISSSFKNDALYLIGKRKLDLYLKEGLRRLAVS